ncbi:MAG: hypothetical protein ACRD1T_01035 [Acidimicrobiia bacterium]
MASRVRIIIRSDSLEQLREIAGREDMDLNCGGAKKTPTGEWTVEAYVRQQVATRLRKAGVHVEVDKEFEKRVAARRAEVGAGDRFQGGRTPPRGVGRKE